MEDIIFKDISISSIKELPSETTRPAHLGGPDFRGLCVNIPYNDKCDERLNLIVTDIQNSTCTLSFSEEELGVIKDSEVLRKLISEMIIRFDTDPSFYTKQDYQVLVAILSKTIPYLYSQSDVYNQELNNLDSIINNIGIRIDNLKLTVDDIDVGVTSITTHTDSQHVRVSTSDMSGGKVGITVDVVAVDASDNYSIPAKGLVTDSYVNEKIASVSSFTAGDNIKIENGVISAEIPEDIQFKTDVQLVTQNKTVVGAINELKSTLDITIPLLQAGL